MRKVIAVKDWFIKQEPWTKAALGGAGALAALGIADLTRWKLPDRIADDRQIALLVVTETVLLALVFWVVDVASDRRARRQWEATAGPVIATLRVAMGLTFQRLDRAARHPDSETALKAMALAGSSFLSLVQTKQGILLVHPELAIYAPKFTAVAEKLAHAGGSFAPSWSIRRVAAEPSGKAYLAQLREEVKRLEERTEEYEGSLSVEPEAG